MVTFHDCIQEIVLNLCIIAHENARNTAGLESTAGIRVETKTGIVIGLLEEVRNEAIVIHTPKATITILLTDLVQGADGQPKPIELFWTEWFPVGGYYGETQEEYGGAPEPLPRTIATRSMHRQANGDWVAM